MNLTCTCPTLLPYCPALGHIHHILVLELPNFHSSDDLQAILTRYTEWQSSVVQGFLDHVAALAGVPFSAAPLPVSHVLGMIALHAAALHKARPAAPAMHMTGLWPGWGPMDGRPGSSDTVLPLPASSSVSTGSSGDAAARGHSPASPRNSMTVTHRMREAAARIGFLRELVPRVLLTGLTPGNAASLAAAAQADVTTDLQAATSLPAWAAAMVSMLVAPPSALAHADDFAMDADGAFQPAVTPVSSPTAAQGPLLPRLAVHATGAAVADVLADLVVTDPAGVRLAAATGPLGLSAAAATAASLGRDAEGHDLPGTASLPAATGGAATLSAQDVDGTLASQVQSGTHGTLLVHALRQDAAVATDALLVSSSGVRNTLMLPPTRPPGAVWEGPAQLAELPQVRVESCADSSIYMLRPAGHAFVAGCTSSTVVVSAVGGVLTVEACEGCIVIAAARQVRVVNCVSCTLLLATPQSPVCIGDCRALVMGPLAITYPRLAAHLRAAGLAPDQHTNLHAWRRPHLAGVHRASSHQSSRPLESADIASIMVPSLFQLHPVPYDVGLEHEPVPGNPPATAVQLVTRAAPLLAEDCIVPLPAEYATVLGRRKAAVDGLRSLIGASDLSDEQATELQTALQAHFREWLATSGALRGVGDSVRLHRVGRFGLPAHRHTRSHSGSSIGSPPPAHK